MQPEGMGVRWDAIRSDVQKRWGRLTAWDLDAVQGDLRRLTALVEDKYGYSARRANREVTRFLERYGTKGDDSQPMLRRAWHDMKRVANRYPWTAMAGGVVVALLALGLISESQDHRCMEDSP